MEDSSQSQHSEASPQLSPKRITAILTAVLRKVDAWEWLQEFEGRRGEAIGRRVNERPESFRWVDGIPHRRRDLIAARIAGQGTWEGGWRTWAAKWIDPQP